MLTLMRSAISARERPWLSHETASCFRAIGSIISPRVTVGVPEDHHGGDDSDSTSNEKADCRAIHGSAWLAGRSSSHLEPLLVRSVTARLASGIATRNE